MENHKPTLSVLTPNYCHGKYLPMSIESVLRQSRLPDEYIICDDASTDESVQIIQSYIDRFPHLLKLVSNEQNKGGIATMARLFTMAAGEYISTLAADDFLLPTFFEKAMEMAQRYPSAGIIFGKMMVVDDYQNILDVVGVNSWTKPQYISPERFASEYLDCEPPNHSLCGATIWRRDALEEVGYFNTSLHSWGDTFSTRAIALKYGACYIPEPVMCWRYLSESLSNTTAKTIETYSKIIDDAVALMRSPEFRDRFPEKHVTSWSRRYKDLLIDLHARPKMLQLSKYKEAIGRNIKE